MELLADFMGVLGLLGAVVGVEFVVCSSDVACLLVGGEPEPSM